MKNIAVITSGTGSRGRRLADIFNSGERFKVALLLSDRMAEALENYSTLGIPAACAAPEEWSNPEEILRVLRENNIDIIALDGFERPLPPEVEAEYADKIILLDDETGAREIMRRFGNDFHTEQVWADALGMEFDPERAVTPPPVPEMKETLPPPLPPQGQPSFNPAPFRAENAKAPAGQPPMPKTYLLWSVLALIFCCIASGVVAVIFSSSVSSRYYAGDYEGAERASRRAQIWIIVSIVAGVVTNAMVLPMMLIS